MNAITAPFEVREAVDHARLLVTISDQIHECLAGEREYAYIATNQTMLPTAEHRTSIAEVFMNWLIKRSDTVNTDAFADLFCSLDDDGLRARLKHQLDGFVYEVADATLSALTPDELEALT